MQQMNSYLPVLGVTAETAPAIEASYEALLGILEQHFASHPYLLGGRPSIADFGLMAPLFAHLSRDPVPSNLMKLDGSQRLPLDRAHEPRPDHRR